MYEKNSATPQVTDIAKDIDIREPADIKRAQAELAQVTMPSLFFTANPDDWGGSHSVAIALARMEIERRRQNSAKTLAYRTTIISSLMGIFGIILGFILGYAFSH